MHDLSRPACEEIQVWISCLWLVFRPLKSGCFFGNIFVELVLKSFSGRNYYLEPPVFWFSNSFLYGLEESRQLWILIRWVFGLLSIKSDKNFSQQFFCAFKPPLWIWIFTNYFEILIFAFFIIMPRGVSTCKILLFWNWHFQKYKALKIIQIYLEPPILEFSVWPC